MRVLGARLPCGFMRTNRAGRVVAGNRALAAMLGYGAVEALPERLDALLPAAGRLFYQVSMLPTLATGRRMEELYLNLLTAAEETIPVLVSIQPADTTAAASEGYDWAVMRVMQRSRWEAAMLEARRVAEQKTEEAAQAATELARALAELKESNWMLRKVAEVLPTCMYCGQVKAGEDGWQTAIDYLKSNSRFLSHGCCPSCTARMRRDMGLPINQ